MESKNSPRRAFSITALFSPRRESAVPPDDDEARRASEAQRQSRLTAEKLAVQRELAAQKELFSQLLETLADAIDAKDEYTTGHSYRVSEYVRLMGQALGYGEAEVEALREEALLHDVGKIGVPDVVLNKAGRLSEQEALVIHSHTTIGGDILQKLTRIPGAVAVARYHHERYDGKGYPAGLKGEDIPAHARIVAVADTFDAMHSDRTYRKGLPLNVIRAEMEKGRGTQFDPKFLDVFLLLLAQGRLDHILSINSRMRSAGTQAEFRDALQKRVDQEGRAARRGRKPLTPRCDAVTSLKSMQAALALQYSQRFDVIVVTLKPKNGETVSREQQEQALAAMGFAAKKSLEGVGVCAYCSVSQLLVLLYDTSVNTVDMLLQRVYLDFFRLTDSGQFDLSYFEI